MVRGGVDVGESFQVGTNQTRGVGTMASRREMDRAKVYRKQISERERRARDRGVMDLGGGK